MSINKLINELFFDIEKERESMEEPQIVTIKIPSGKKALWVNNVLTLVDEKQNDVTERIKTFDDACLALGNDNPLVKHYRRVAVVLKSTEQTEDIIAYLQLRIITAALNEDCNSHLVFKTLKLARYARERFQAIYNTLGFNPNTLALFHNNEQY